MKKRMIQVITVTLILAGMILRSITANDILMNHEPEMICTMEPPVLLPQEVPMPQPVEVEIVTAAPKTEIDTKLKRTVPAEEQIINEPEEIPEDISVDETEVFEVGVEDPALSQQLPPILWTAEEIELANLVEAEAGNQGLRGKQLVADVVLNRVDSDVFPDTIHDVIFQRGQFSVINDGQFARMSSRITEESLIAARTELAGPRIDSGILYFNSGSRCANGSGGWKYKDHWFAY